MKYPVNIDIAEVENLQTALDGLQALIDSLYSPIQSFPYGASDYRCPVEGNPANATYASGTMLFIPWFNRYGFAANEIGIKNGQNSGQYKLAFYAMGADMAPSNLLWDSGDLAGSDANWKYVVKPLTLQRGWYWIASITSATVQILASNNTFFPLGGTPTASTAVAVNSAYSLTTPYSTAFPPTVTKSSLALVTGAVQAARSVPFFCYR
jgi:hypothetical protein